MAFKRLSMRKIHRVLRLFLEAGLSIRAIARSLQVSPSTVGDYIRRARTAGLSWPLPERLDERASKCDCSPSRRPRRALSVSYRIGSRSTPNAAARASPSRYCGRSTRPSTPRGCNTQGRAIRNKKLTGPAKLAHRREHSLAAVEAFFAWCKEQRQRPDLLSRNPLASALHYVVHRETGLPVFLDIPEVSIDTNHLERSLRPIPTGRRNWLFAWTELGAQCVGVIQSLLVTCRLQGVDP